MAGPSRASGPSHGTDRSADQRRCAGRAGRGDPPTVTYDGFQTARSVVAWDAPSVALLGEHHRSVTCHAMRPLVGTAVNDMRYYNFAGTPAGCYRATGGNGHAADEWLDLTSLAPAAKVLGGFIIDWCSLVE